LVTCVEIKIESYTSTVRYSTESTQWSRKHSQSCTQKHHSNDAHRLELKAVDRGVGRFSRDPELEMSLKAASCISKSISTLLKKVHIDNASEYRPSEMLPFPRVL